MPIDMIRENLGGIKMSNSVLHQEKRETRAKNVAYNNRIKRPKRLPAIQLDTNHHNK